MFNTKNKYLIQMINQEDGAKSSAFVLTPVELVEQLKAAHPDLSEAPKAYVNLILDVDAIDSIPDDEARPIAEYVTPMPLLAIRNFIHLVEEAQ